MAGPLKKGFFSASLNDLFPKVPAVFTAVVAPELGLLQLRAAQVRCVLRVQPTRIPVAPDQGEGYILRVIYILPQIYTSNHATFPVQMYANTV